jgi:hypothetical protein
MSDGGDALVSLGFKDVLPSVLKRPLQRDEFLIQVWVF